MNAPADSRRFRAAREDEWRRLEEILTRAETKSVRALCRRGSAGAADPLSRRPVLAVGGARDLARPRAGHLSRGAVRARLFLRLRRAHLGRRAGSPPSSRRDWPARGARPLARDAGRRCCDHPDRRRSPAICSSPRSGWFDSFVPPELAGGRDFTATAEYPARHALRRRRRAAASPPSRPSCSPTTPRSAILRFALGFAFGVPTAMLLVYNGAMLGAIFALVRLARPRLRDGRLADHPRLDRDSSRSSWPARPASGSAGAWSFRARRAGSPPRPRPGAARRS